MKVVEGLSKTDHCTDNDMQNQSGEVWCQCRKCKVLRLVEDVKKSTSQKSSSEYNTCLIPFL